MFRHRRSLGKNISQSKRVNKLSDMGALLYTWMIPHLDDDGRMDGDPEDVKYNVLPRREITTDEITEQLSLMDKLDLIVWYSIEGRWVIQLNPEAWEEHQTFSGIKRIPSKIPAYDPDKHERYRQLSTVSSGQVHCAQWTGTLDAVDMSTVHTPQEKLREEKLNSFSSSEEKQAKPASSESKHFSENISGEYLKPIVEVCQALQRKSNGKRFNPYAFVQQNIRGHPGAILKSLQGLLKQWGTTKNPWAFVNAIIKTEDQNYNEKDRIQAHEQLKQEFAIWEKSKDAKKLKDLLGDTFEFP